MRCKILEMFHNIFFRPGRGKNSNGNKDTDLSLYIYGVSRPLIIQKLNIAILIFKYGPTVVLQNL